MSEFDKETAYIIKQLNSIEPKYATVPEQIAWQQGLLIALLAYAMHHDSAVIHRFRAVIDQHNKT